MTVFRVATLGYAVALFALRHAEYPRQAAAAAVLAAMTAWTLLLALAAAGRTPPTLSARLVGAPGHVLDLAAACGAVLATRLVDAPERIAAGAQTLPVAWPAAAVLGWAVWRGWRGGLVAAALVGLADLVVLAGIAPVGGTTVHNVVLLLLLGGIVGYSADLFRAGQAALARAVTLRAATRERERLAREVHDGVLQVLALVQRRGAEAGGEVAELGRLAGEQERRLRGLVSRPLEDEDDARVPRSAGAAGAAADVDLHALLRALGGERVSVVGPAGPVPVPRRSGEELAAAVAAALDNVRRHAGPSARAWVLLEDEGDAVVVTVRDDGVGVEESRLREAAAEGRLGVAASVVGRVRDLGGRAEYDGRPGAGTTVTLRVPRRAAAGGGS